MTTEALGKAADDLNTALDAAGEALRLLGLGVRASVSLGDAGELAFGKHSDRWQLLHVKGETVGPLTSASREIRIMASAHLNRLLSAIYSARGDEMKRVREATEAVESFTKSISTEAT